MFGVACSVLDFVCHCSVFEKVMFQGLIISETVQVTDYPPLFPRLRREEL